MQKLANLNQDLKLKFKKKKKKKDRRERFKVKMKKKTSIIFKILLNVLIFSYLISIYFGKRKKILPKWQHENKNK